jgi:hypothetical protein
LSFLLSSIWTERCNMGIVSIWSNIYLSNTIDGETKIFHLQSFYSLHYLTNIYLLFSFFKVRFIYFSHIFAYKNDCKSCVS